MVMNQSKSRSWKMERASVNVKGKLRSRSNRYSHADSHRKPEPGSRERVWVGGYTRGDGTKVHGYHRNLAKS
jgi:hypothetical protein